MSSCSRLGLAAVVAFAAVVAAPRALGAAPGGPAPTPEAPGAPVGPAPRPPPKLADPYSLVQIEVGLLAFPAAELCPDPTEVCTPGETSFALGAQNVTRLGDFALGAGLTWAFGLRPGTSSRGDPENALERRHSRSYFVFEGLFRYYLPTVRSWEWWVGASLGGVVINDSWSTLADREPYSDVQFVGPEAMSLRTEGLTVGAGAGASWSFAERWSFGARLGYSNWVLPQEREQTPLGDAASLAGRVDIFQLGLVGGFLVRL